jgi:hypothetical protein
MRNFCIQVVGAVFSSVLALGCAQDAGQCSRPIGEYRAAFTPLNGNCTQVMARGLKFSKDDPLVTVQTTTSLSDSVVTEVNLIGCTVAVKQSISDAKGSNLVASLKGELDVEEAALTGRFAYQEFMPDGKTLRCASDVEASYTLMEGTGNSTLGAAALHVLSSP